MVGYIYLIVNKLNGKTYIGQRRTKKNYNLDSYMGSGVWLKNAKNKYGLENFEKFLIQYCNSEEELNKKEIFWIAEYRKRGKAEYNIADGGVSDIGSIGRQHISNALMGHIVSEETKQKMSETRKKRHIEPWNKGKNGVQHGHKPTEEQILQLIEYNKTRVLSEDTLKKMSESHKGKTPWNKGKTGVQKAWNKGVHHSEKTKNKISESKKGKHWKLVDGKRVYY